MRALGPALTLALVVLAGCGSDSAASAECGGRTWISAWQAPPTDAFLPIDASLHWLTSGPDQTFRVMLTPLGGGRAARVHVTNRFGRETVRLAAVRLGRRAEVPGSSPEPPSRSPSEASEASTSRPARTWSATRPSSR
ncbi:MAG: hypothetical protein IPK07_34215 [Deltaproteobacteria bacterium]|nr:hypothetical protein [Deltaproteobacteria bacterium]